MTEKWVCPQCEHENDVENEFCENCGQSRDELETHDVISDEANEGEGY